MKNFVLQNQIFYLLAIIICSISCQTLDPVALTKFSNTPPVASEIKYNSVNITGKFMDVGDGLISYGHCWSNTQNPVITGFKTTNSGNPEKQVEFSSQLNGLLPETKYYARAYAELEGNTVYSKEIDFTTLVILKINKPISEDRWNIGFTQHIIWTDLIDENVKITLLKNNQKYLELINSTESDGSFDWTIPSNFPLSSDYAIKIESINNTNISDTSSLFSITDDPYISITAPMNSANWLDGQAHEIKWSDNINENVDIELYKGGVKNTNIVLNAPSNQNYSWNIPNSIIGANNYTIKITSTNNSSVVGESGVFTIIDAPFINVTSPIANINWSIAKEYEIKWIDNITENVNIELLKGGVKNRDIVLNTANDNSHLWTVSASLVAGNDYSIKITSTINATIIGKSDQFTISESVVDIDGNVYSTVTIGTQVWMVESMKTTKYRNGDLIGTTNPANLVITGEHNAKYQWAPDFNEAKVQTYGRLYTWHTANEIRFICPAGWHVPSDNEWTMLTNFLGGESVAGDKLKESGTVHWGSGNPGANNSSGFTALPGGDRGPDGAIYGGGGGVGYFWTSTENGTTGAWHRDIKAWNGEVNRAVFDKDSGFSVRCLKD